MAQFVKEIVDRVQQRTFDQFVHVPMFVEEIIEIHRFIVDASQVAPQERSHQRIVEQIVPYVVPQVVEDFAVMDQIISEERISDRISCVSRAQLSSNLGAV